MARKILIKYGGNAMEDEQLREEVINEVSQIKSASHQVVLVHGGGPFIAHFLEIAKIESEFVEGHRVTDDKAIHYVEAALKGYVSGSLVSLCEKKNMRAIGLSGKDAGMVHCRKKTISDKSLGWVGEITRVDVSLLKSLLEQDILPIVTCIATDEEGQTYNVNGDLFAAHLAAHLKADQFLVLTNTEGLYEDVNRPETLIRSANQKEIETRYRKAVSGGMIPKVEACFTALNGGVNDVKIINGMQPANLSAAAIDQKEIGTKFIK